MFPVATIHYSSEFTVNKVLLMRRAHNMLPVTESKEIKREKMKMSCRVSIIDDAVDPL